MCIVIDNVVHDVTVFVDNHPGGSVIKTYVGKPDASAVFYGGVHDHSNAAINLLSTMRIARYHPCPDDSTEEEIDEKKEH